MPASVSKLDDPTWRRERARRARAAQQTPEYYVRQLEQMVDEAVENAPPFSDEVVDKLRRIFQAADRPASLKEAA